MIQGDSLDVKGSSPPSHAAFNGCIPHETKQSWETGRLGVGRVPSACTAYLQYIYNGLILLPLLSAKVLNIFIHKKSFWESGKSSHISLAERSMVMASAVIFSRYTIHNTHKNHVPIRSRCERNMSTIRLSIHVLGSAT